MVSDNSRPGDVSCLLLDHDVADNVFVTRKWSSSNLGTSVDKLLEACGAMKVAPYRDVRGTDCSVLRRRQGYDGSAVWGCPWTTSYAGSPSP
mmetsp:Transcript_10851/g.14338  ORF Transcript_10851/g.14338 Transcript_10851/m.14338 type:complete len:92 (-) Transcript_10851:734-1009(-)